MALFRIPRHSRPHKTFFLAVLPLLAGLACALPASSAESLDAPKKDAPAEKLLEGILAKEGITLGGEFRSQYLHSSIGGPAALSSRRSEESVEFTSVDFDIRARPNTATQGRLMVRMHQDWRNFFSDIGNPINTRWISIDGSLKEMFSYNIGDFHQRYSPLTLHAPEFDVLYEPALFSGNRREAMDEAFLGNRNRLLQGVNLNFDAAVDRGSKGLFNELHLNILGSRLRNVETSIQNGNKATAGIERSLVEKFLTAANTDMTFPFGASLGGSWLLIFDKNGSYAGPGEADTATQHTRVLSGRTGFDLATLTGAEDWNVGFTAEYAMSKDDTNFYATPADSVITRKAIDGTALLARLSGSWKGGKTFGIRLGLNYLANAADYRNELAQSPVFIGERILNIENDTDKVRTNGVSARNYSTFDAMYEHVFKFAPSEQTNLWQRAPFSKNSYRNSIMTQGEMAAFAATRTDMALQMVMPFGPATPNRGGIQSDLTLSFLDERIEAQAVFAALENVSGVKVDSTTTLPNTKFTQAGGGLKVEAGALIGLSLPFTLSGSLVRSTAKNAGIASDTIHTASKATSDFLNAGMQYSFWKRFSVLAGYQRITNTLTENTEEDKQVQTHVAGGLGYKVASGANLLFSLGQVKVDNHEDATDADFSQLQTDLFLSVRF